MKSESRPAASTFARLVETSATEQNLAHLKPQSDTLRAIAGQARQGGAVTALLVGFPAGATTAAATALAAELGRKLYRIDLAATVSKYIGETEKNLSRLFADTTAADSILFFDEADALFGRRTEVSDAHDRYANTASDDLLQRLEAFPGLTILAVTSRSSVDAAFLRRIRYVVEYPEPPRR